MEPFRRKSGFQGLRRFRPELQVIGSMTGRQAGRTLRALTAGLVLLVVALTPLHTHGGGSEAPTACLLCQVTHQALDLPSGDQAAAWLPTHAAHAMADSTPLDGPPAEVRSGEPGNPRAPPQYS